MLLLRSAGAVLAVRARRRRQNRILRRRVPIPRHLRARRQVLVGRALVVLHILRLRPPRNPILHRPHRQAGHLAVRVPVLRVPAQALDRFLVVRVVRLRLPLSAVHRAVLLQKVTASRAKKVTAGRPTPTKAVLMSLAIIAPAQ